MTCPHGEPHSSCCLDCLEAPGPELPRRPEAKPAAVTRPFVARFPGHCAGCNLAIHEGQAIVRMADETHRHQCCGGAT